VSVQTDHKVDIDEARRKLAESLGPAYRVTIASASALKVGRPGVIPAKVQLDWSEGATSFRVSTTGLILSRLIQTGFMNPRIRRALKESFP